MAYLRSLRKGIYPKATEEQIDDEKRARLNRRLQYGDYGKTRKQMYEESSTDWGETSFVPAPKKVISKAKKPGIRKPRSRSATQSEREESSELDVEVPLLNKKKVIISAPPPAPKPKKMKKITRKDTTINSDGSEVEIDVESEVTDMDTGEGFRRRRLKKGKPRKRTIKRARGRPMRGRGMDGGDRAGGIMYYNSNTRPGSVKTFRGFYKNGKRVQEFDFLPLLCKDLVTENFLEVKTGLDENPNALDDCPVTFEELFKWCKILERSGIAVTEYEPFLEGCDWVNALSRLARATFGNQWDPRLTHCPNMPSLKKIKIPGVPQDALDSVKTYAEEHPDEF